MPVVRKNPHLDMKSKWLRPVRQNPGATVRLFCFHHAGVGATFYYPWAQALEPFAEVWCVQLPGREDRRGEPPVTDIRELTPILVDALVSHATMPYVLFGHSLGALISYSVSRRLQNMKHVRRPVAQFVSAMRAPSLAHTRVPLAKLDDEAFIEQINNRYGGLPEIFLKEPDLLQFFLPVIRADVSLLESFEYESGERFDWPLFVFGGLDDVQASGEMLNEWGKEAAGVFEVHEFPGGHFYLQQERAQVTERVQRLTRDVLTGVR